MEAAIVILCVVILFLMVSLGVIISKNSDLSELLNIREKESEKLKKDLEKPKPVPTKFLPGMKGLIYNHGLSRNNQTEDFTVTYEVNIVEVSKTKLKVCAYDFTSNNAIGKDPSMRTSIINFLQNFWIDKNSVEPILDQSDLREEKINTILS